MTPSDDLHDLAVACGAMVLGEPGTPQHYLFNAKQLARFVSEARGVGDTLPPCPVELPRNNAPGV